MTDDDSRRQTSVPASPAASKDDAPHRRGQPAGPHAKPELTNEDRTPGAGTLPETGETAVGDGASS